MVYDNLTQDGFKELLVDFNLDYLLDLHDELIEKNYYLGIMQKSKSNNFIHCILESFILIHQENVRPIEDNNI